MGAENISDFFSCGVAFFVGLLYFIIVGVISNLLGNNIWVMVAGLIIWWTVLSIIYVGKQERQ